MRPALGLAASHHALSDQRAPGLGHNSALSLLVVLVVEIYHHPVRGAVQLMSARGVGEQCGKILRLTLGVQYR